MMKASFVFASSQIHDITSLLTFNHSDLNHSVKDAARGHANIWTKVKRNSGGQQGVPIKDRCER